MGRGGTLTTRASGAHQTEAVWDQRDWKERPLQGGDRESRGLLRFTSLGGEPAPAAGWVLVKAHGYPVPGPAVLHTKLSYALVKIW